MDFSFKSVQLSEDGRSVIILDQTLLPAREHYLSLSTADEMWEAIHQLRVRGAPAIGVSAAYGLYVSLLNDTIESAEAFNHRFYHIKAYLDSARPTAVNLSAALNRMERCYRQNISREREIIMDALLLEAQQIHHEDLKACRSIGENGLSLLRPSMGILTHCNAGHLATSALGTALSPLYIGEERGYGFKVFADETRPLLQGARLTAYELMKAGVDTTLICDNMAAVVMSKGWVDAVLVGCDRVAMNGDIANKVGTSTVAILAKHYNIPFYVLGPVSTIDRTCATGEGIVIEERTPEEITSLWYTEQMTPKGCKTFNPSFDVTPHDLIAAIVTERGIARPPFTESLPKMVDES